jgi:hypothetical protein
MQFEKCNITFTDLGDEALNLSHANRLKLTGKSITVDIRSIGRWTVIPGRKRWFSDSDPDLIYLSPEDHKNPRSYYILAPKHNYRQEFNNLFREHLNNCEKCYGSWWIPGEDLSKILHY